jgi:hypothetical protein
MQSSGWAGVVLERLVGEGAHIAIVIAADDKGKRLPEIKAMNNVHIGLHPICRRTITWSCQITHCPYTGPLIRTLEDVQAGKTKNRM